MTFLPIQMCKCDKMCITGYIGWEGGGSFNLQPHLETPNIRVQWQISSQPWRASGSKPHKLCKSCCGNGFDSREWLASQLMKSYVSLSVSFTHAHTHCLSFSLCYSILTTQYLLIHVSHSLLRPTSTFFSQSFSLSNFFYHLTPLLSDC